jgi:hypothetical protein
VSVIHFPSGEQTYNIDPDCLQLSKHRSFIRLPIPIPSHLPTVLRFTPVWVGIPQSEVSFDSVNNVLCVGLYSKVIYRV